MTSQAAKFALGRFPSPQCGNYFAAAAVKTCACMHIQLLHAANMHVMHMQLRGLGGGAAATCNWITNAVVSQTFLTLIQHVGGSGTFWLYAVIALAGAVWVYSALPETNGEQAPTMSTIPSKDQQS